MWESELCDRKAYTYVYCKCSVWLCKASKSSSPGKNLFFPYTHKRAVEKVYSNSILAYADHHLMSHYKGKGGDVKMWQQQRGVSFPISATICLSGKNENREWQHMDIPILWCRLKKSNINNFSIAKMNAFYTVLRIKHGEQHIQQKGFSLVNLNYQRAQVIPMREDRICDQGFGSAHPTHPNENWVFLGGPDRISLVSALIPVLWSGFCGINRETRVCVSFPLSLSLPTMPKLPELMQLNMAVTQGKKVASPFYPDRYPEKLDSI